MSIAGKLASLFALYQTNGLFQSLVGQPLTSGDLESICFPRRGCQFKAMGKENNLYHLLSQLEEKVKSEGSH